MSSSVQGLVDLSDLRSLMPYAIAFLSAADDASEMTRAVKDTVRRFVQDDPLDTLLTVVIGGGIALHLAERETNPACRTPWDGIRTMAAILASGDASHVATDTGRALATVAQTFGPALAFSAFQPPAAEKRAAEAEAAAVNRAILARLDDIVRLLSR